MKETKWEQQEQVRPETCWTQHPIWDSGPCEVQKAKKHKASELFFPDTPEEWGDVQHQNIPREHHTNY